VAAAAAGAIRRAHFSFGYQDNLGFGFMTALGVKAANPGRAVVSISGDGGFMYGFRSLRPPTASGALQL
jgi:thiamine pyrophosphate-dependent acetolactate synthase large subunit-like protein